MKTSKIIIIFFVLLFLSLNSCSQTQNLELEVNNHPGNTVKLARFEGDNMVPVNEKSCREDGVVFDMNSQKPGMYRVILKEPQGREEQGKAFNFIFNNEKIKLETDYNAPQDSLRVLHSDENKIYHEFLDYHQKFEHKMNLLNQMVDQYPKDDPFYEQVADKYLLVQKKHEEYIDSLAQQHSNTFAAHVIKSYKTPVLEPEFSPKEKNSYLKEHFLNSIDFQDTMLIRTPRLGQKILRYLSLYRSQGLSRSEQEQEFIKAVDEILLHAYINDRMYNYVLEYLVKGFEQFNMEKVLTHIYEKNLSGEACKDNNADIKKRLEQYAKLSPGKKAPDFAFNPLNGSKTQLSEMNSPYTLLLFYASWCGHCQNSVPKIHEVYQNYKDKGLEVVAISLDEEKDKYLAFLEKEDYEWLNYCDYKKWESPIVQKYNIYATPTMLLLKEDMTIAGKPITVDELKKALEGVDWE